jgi:hypothetical protein
MTVLIATDVFGATPAVASLVRSLACPCVVVSPFDDPAHYFQSEQKAYHAFLAQGGVARYSAKVSALLQGKESHAGETPSPQPWKLAIGFSVGASALWLSSVIPEAAQLQGAILFYGSRIRDHLDLQPVCPVRLIFAEKEVAFDATLLTSELRQRGHQAELAQHTGHGFMNPYCARFHVKAQSMYLAQLAALAQQ